ncbi:hypothetical protein T4B_6318 [Trichinella pseudospiralis]|uniref:Uncharacterized protein n=2 Tax=Trichinella pseudospiralis TaxID=6337 RepID=A0A0V1FWG3_TRIPS|nr:hypothetical protein T4D_12083 [Trichinella pseudospiralis]KRZ33571.1 hypothetical protein T4B_6318 [Trichinella pseudospiralis]
MEQKKIAYLVPSVKIEPTSNMVRHGDLPLEFEIFVHALWWMMIMMRRAVMQFRINSSGITHGKDGLRLVVLIVQKQQHLNFANSKRFAPNCTQSAFYTRRSGLTINPKANICLVNKPSRSLHSFALSAPFLGKLSTNSSSSSSSSWIPDSDDEQNEIGYQWKKPTQREAEHELVEGKKEQNCIAQMKAQVQSGKKRGQGTDGSTSPQKAYGHTSRWPLSFTSRGNKANLW